MAYNIQISRQAQKELSEIHGKIYERIRDTIRSLSKNPRPSGCLKLTEREGWRIRVGHYRVVYDIDDDNKIVTILNIGHRKDVYR
jgi:mRNA interferase RelE/StbE